MRAQNPPATVNSPPEEFRELASGWPIVPVNEYSPPAEVPPPLSMVLLTISISPPDWANVAAVIKIVRAVNSQILVLFKVVFPDCMDIYRTV